MIHETVPAKINCYVDKALAPLIEALSDLDPALTTISCCQGDADDPDGEGAARVDFHYGDNSLDGMNTNWEPLCELVFGRLAIPLFSSEVIDDVEFRVLASNPKKTGLTCRLTIRPGRLDAVTEVLRQMASGFPKRELLPRVVSRFPKIQEG